MQNKSAAIVCALTLPALLILAAWAEDSQNITANSTTNSTVNLTGNISNINIINDTKLSQTANATSGLSAVAGAANSSQNPKNATVESETPDDSGVIQSGTGASGVNEAIIVVDDPESKSASQDAGQQRKVLRAGFEETKAVNNLDVYGNRSAYSIGGSNNSSSGDAFNINQRVGSVANMTYTTDYSPIYTADEYSRTKAVYEAPENLSNRSVYNISGYPAIKATAAIP